jgi:PAS domain S-box-containing protein
MMSDDEFYRRIVQSVPEGIWVVNTHGRTTFCNQRMADLLGTDTETLRNLSCFDPVFPADLEDAKRQFGLQVTGVGQPFDFRLRRIDGSAISVRISCLPVHDDAGNVVELLGLFTDITERLQTEAALRESEERFRNMADTAPVMIWCSGQDKLFTFFNKVWLDFTGRTMEQELGNGWTERVHPADLTRCLETYSTAFDAHRRFRMEYRLCRADGEYRWILYEGVPRLTPDGTFVGYIGSCIDITEVKRTQEETLAHQKLESVGQLAGGIAHDFNNLLSGILACAEFALAEMAEGTLPSEEHLGRIRTGAIRGAEIVRQLMTYAGEVRPAFEPVDLSSLVEEMLQLLRISVSKNAILEADLGADLRAVHGNPAQIRQIVMNLVMNASEAIGRRAGRIRVTTVLVRVGRDARGSSAANLPEGEYVKLEVSDTGTGMTPEVQTRIFDPFFTTKSPGHGLGLAVIQGIVRSHLGAINIVSSAGQGSRFEILLPCVDQPALLFRARFDDLRQ